MISLRRLRATGLAVVLAFSSGPAAAAGDGGPATPTLTIDSGMVEPAVPLNLVLKVRVLAGEPIVEVTVVIGKRAGFPTALFFDKNVEARINLPAGLDLDSGGLTWTGELRGDRGVEFVARIRAVRDVQG